MYLKKFGGGASQEFCIELINFLNLMMFAGRKIGSDLFRELGRVQVSAEFSIPHVLNAIIKANCTCDVEHTIDGFGKVGQKLKI